MAHPLFVLTCVCREKSVGISVLDNACELIQKAIESKGGEFSLKSKPEIMGADEKIEDEESDEDDDEDEAEGSDQEGMGKIDMDDEAMKELMNKKLDDDE
eukprot:gb/GFBE01055740.1/.p1 GENE.gb/GFBE01055740.1/~~gb/GFBE01055740.1/.p1  ORF type:complete len:100 (+),score=53.35 gb/GFBE01055740.1/:1-300(+)